MRVPERTTGDTREREREEVCEQNQCDAIWDFNLVCMYVCVCAQECLHCVCAWCRDRAEEGAQGAHLDVGLVGHSNPVGWTGLHRMYSSREDERKYEHE